MEIHLEANGKITPEFQALIEKCKGTFSDVLGVTFEEASKEKVVASLKVEERHLQPFGYLHGGVSLALSETLTSLGALLHIDTASEIVLGQEINANHLKSIKEGTLIGEAYPLHIGMRSQVWEVKIKDGRNKGLIAVSRCTLAVLKRR